MGAPDRSKVLALDVLGNGVPFARVAAKSTVSPDNTYNGLPFLVVTGAGGTPPADPIAVPIYSWESASGAPISDATIVGEVNELILTESGFTIVEDDGTPPANPATLELFQTSTPTAGDWVLGRLYTTNAPSDGVLRSPLPAVTGVTKEATLTVVTTAPHTMLSFEWGVLGEYYGTGYAEIYNDRLTFFIDGVEQAHYYATTPAISPLYESRGEHVVVLPPGTYALRWTWDRGDGNSQRPDLVHAWIAGLIIDPNF